MKLTERVTSEFKQGWPFYITHPVCGAFRVASLAGESLNRKVGEWMGDASYYPNDFGGDVGDSCVAYLGQLMLTPAVTYDLTNSIPAAIGSLVGQIGLTYVAGAATDKLNGVDSREEDERFASLSRTSFKLIK